MVPLLILLACLFDRWSLAESLERGRLSATPAYDDVTYFYAGAQLLQSARGGQFGAMLTGYQHSPFSASVAALSYALWGNRDWAPYAGNTVVALVYLGGLYFFLRRLPLGLQLGLFVFFLSLPFAKMGVVEFRPDIMWSSFVGIGAVYLIVSPAPFSSRREALLLGILYAAAMLTKPTTFLMTTAVFGLAGLLRTIRAALTGKFQPRPFLLWLLFFVLPFLLIGLPFFIAHLDRLWAYFMENGFGKNKELWRPTLTTVEKLLFYLDARNATPSNFGLWRLPLFFFVAGALVLGLWKARDRGPRLIFLSLVLLLLTTWVACSLFSIKSPFMGGAFYGCLLFTVAYLLALLLEPLAKAFAPPLRQILAFAAIVIVSAVCYTWPAYSVWNPAMAKFHRKASKAISREITTAFRDFQPADGRLDIYYSNTSPIPRELPLLRGVQSGHPVNFNSGAMLETLEEQRRIFEQSDLLVVQDPGLPWVNLGFPGEKIQAAINQEILSRPEFQLACEVQLTPNGKLYIFRNKNSLQPKP